MNQCNESIYRGDITKTTFSVTQKALEEIFESSRTRHSSYAPKRLAFLQPKRFQCLPTSLIIQELFGGELAVAKIFIHDELQKKILKKDCTYHFSNIIKNEEVDMTAWQIQGNKNISIGSQRKLTEGDIRNLYIVCDNLEKKKDYLSQRVIQQLSKNIGLSHDELLHYLGNGEKILLV